MKLRVLGLVLVASTLLAGCNLVFGPQDEGSPSNPVLIAVGIPYSGTVSSYGTSYYTFTPFGSGWHTISLSNTQSDLSWELYGSAWNSLDWCDDWDFAADEVASVSLTGGTTYYLTVDEWDFVGGTFTLTVTYP